MKNNFYLCPLFIILCFSLAFFSCGTSSKIAENQVNSTQQSAVQNSVSEDTPELNEIPPSETKAEINNSENPMTQPEKSDIAIPDETEVEEENQELIEDSDIIDELNADVELFLKDDTENKTKETTLNNHIEDNSSVIPINNDKSANLTDESTGQNSKNEKEEIININDDKKTNEQNTQSDIKQVNTVSSVNTQNNIQNQPDKTDSLSTTDTKEENIASEQKNEESKIDVFNNPAVIIPSRSMTVKNNQYVDVVYPGSGWIYIGEAESDAHFRYFGRKLGTTDTTFTLRSIKSGKALLHFYKNDALTSQYIDDYLEVEVLKENAKPNEKTLAPSYAQAVPPKPVRGVTQINGTNAENKKTVDSENQTEEKKAIKTLDNSSEKKQNETVAQNNDISSSENKDLKTIISTTDSQDKIQNQNSFITQTQKPEEKKQETTQNDPINIDPSKSLLEQAKESLQNKKYELALSQIQMYLDSENSKTDEALYVQGQILEADSSVRNIKSAIDSYNTLIKKYPASKFWQEANKRKIYLDRYYINIY